MHAHTYIYVYIYRAYLFPGIYIYIHTYREREYQRRDACMPPLLSDLEWCFPRLHKSEYTYHYAHTYLCVHAHEYVSISE
jgi:hypothetical protein